MQETIIGIRYIFSEFCLFHVYLIDYITESDALLWSVHINWHHNKKEYSMSSANFKIIDWFFKYY